MLTKVKIGALRDAVAQAMHTLDSKAASIGSWMYIFAYEAKDDVKARIYIYSTNLGMARTLLKIDAEVTKAGMALITPKLLQAILGSLPAEEDVELGLSPSGSKLQVKYGSLKSEIAVHADSQKNQEVLKTIPFNAKPSASVSAATLVDSINRTLFCTASSVQSSSEGPWLSSVYLEAGDGIMLATATNRIIAGRSEVHDPLVVPGFTGGVHRDALVALKALLSKRKEEEVTITLVNTEGSLASEVLFRFSDVILGVRQLAKPYPTKVAGIFNVPSGFTTATINRKVFLGTFSRLTSFAERGSFVVTFSGTQARVATKGYGSEYQESLAKTEKTEGQVTIGLGITDVVNVLSVMMAEDVKIHYKTNGDHFYMQEGESNFLYVLSPVQTDWSKK